MSYGSCSSRGMKTSLWPRFRCLVEPSIIIKCLHSLKYTWNFPWNIASWIGFCFGNIVTLCCPQNRSRHATLIKAFQNKDFRSWKNITIWFYAYVRWAETKETQKKLARFSTVVFNFSVLSLYVSIVVKKNVETWEKPKKALIKETPFYFYR